MQQSQHREPSSCTGENEARERLEQLEAGQKESHTSCFRTYRRAFPLAARRLPSTCKICAMRWSSGN
ncbi:hypothetical protein HaLaN_22810 [Haematococcus lacustris]|uniref:Uncharacterized protein n=1 Tax=Haematococcus lacustris TaxID=44745 RepID=A0A699ZUP3_HAELA|nr:hypothetical protein HaLaN_22810 [Haematococcus lacustris]